MIHKYFPPLLSASSTCHLQLRTVSWTQPVPQLNAPNTVDSATPNSSGKHKISNSRSSHSSGWSPPLSTHTTTTMNRDPHRENDLRQNASGAKAKKASSRVTTETSTWAETIDHSPPYPSWRVQLLNRT